MAVCAAAKRPRRDAPGPAPCSDGSRCRGRRTGRRPCARPPSAGPAHRVGGRPGHGIAQPCGGDRQDDIGLLGDVMGRFERRNRALRVAHGGLIEAFADSRRRPLSRDRAVGAIRPLPCPWFCRACSNSPSETSDHARNPRVRTAGNAAPAETLEFEVARQALDDRRVEIRRSRRAPMACRRLARLKREARRSTKSFSSSASRYRLIGRLQSRLMLAGQPQHAGKLAGRRRQPALVPQLSRQRIRLADDGGQPVDLAQRQQRTEGVQPRIDGQTSRTCRRNRASTFTPGS